MNDAFYYAELALGFLAFTACGIKLHPRLTVEGKPAWGQLLLLAGLPLAGYYFWSGNNVFQLAAAVWLPTLFGVILPWVWAALKQAHAIAKAWQHHVLARLGAALAWLDPKRCAWLKRHAAAIGITGAVLLVQGFFIDSVLSAVLQLLSPVLVFLAFWVTEPDYPKRKP